MVFAKSHAKFQANRSRRSRVMTTDPIRMQYAICRYFGHKIVSISLNFRDIKISIAPWDSSRKTAVEQFFFENSNNCQSAMFYPIGPKNNRAPHRPHNMYTKFCDNWSFLSPVTVCTSFSVTCYHDGHFESKMAKTAMNAMNP